MTESTGANQRSSRPKFRRKLAKPLRDALAAGLAFTLIAGPMVCLPSVASPHGATPVTAAKPPATLVQAAIASDEPAPLVQIATASSPSAPDAVYKRTSTPAAWSLLALAFSFIAALNMATVRHLRRAYAAPARRAVRRQPSGKAVSG